MALPPEKITELKQIIHTQLSQMDIQSYIQEALETSLAKKQNGFVSEEDIIRVMKEKGVIDEVMKQIQFERRSHVGVEKDVIVDSYLPAKTHKPTTHLVDVDDKLRSTINKVNVDPTRRYLYLQVLGGRAFLDHLQETPSLPGQITSIFTLHLNFRGQRFRSRPTPCACEPDLQEAFLLELHKDITGSASRMADTTTLLSMCDPVHLVLIRTDPSGETSLVTSHYFEWRLVLTSDSSRCTTTVELMGTGSESKVPVGVLEIRLELMPRLNEALSEDVLAAQVSLEKSRQAERERLFLVYAKQWWKEYLQIRTQHRERLVKIFAQDENSLNRPVCSFLRPMRAGRLLDSPRQAARFVSLLGYEKTSQVGGGEKPEQWMCMHSFLTRGKGDCEDHAILLCSLLLGFGLDAYVCVGTKSKGISHAWVMTRAGDGIITFWESLTGHRYVHRAICPDDPPAVPQPKPTYPYRTIGAVFNHESFYANCQSSDAVEVCQFDLRNESLWKAMSEDAIRSVCMAGMIPVWPDLPPLCPSVVDPILVSNDLERELRVLVTSHRRDMGLTTVWDDNLSYLLTSALAAYELERATGVITGNDEFQQAIRRAVPDGHTFKGFPIQFVHRNARRAFIAGLKSSVCDEIISCRGDHVRLAVRVRVFAYPETACATWIMFACKYKSIV